MLGPIAARLDALAAGTGGIVVVEGAAGTGKTHLLGEIAAQAQARAIRTLHGAQEPFGPFVPFGPLLDALLDARDPLAGSGELRAALTAPGDRRAKLAALRTRIAREAAARPLLVLLDDLQWTDAATLEALRVLPRGLASHPVAWVVALRPGYGTEDVATTLAVLDHAGAARVLLAGPDRRAAADAASIAERVDHLPGAARQLVQLTAVFGRRVGIGDLAQLLGWSHAELADPLARALASGLIVEEGGRLGFREEAVRAAVEGSIPNAVLRGLLRQRVDLDLAAGVPAAAVGPTLAAVAQPGDAEAVAVLRRALRELAGEAPAAAADLGVRAIALAGARTERGAVLAAETVPLLWHAGRIAEARAVGDAALAGALSPEHEAAIRLALVRMETEQSVADAARQGLRGSALEGAPAATRDRLLAVFATSSVRAGTFGDEQLDAAAAAAGSADPIARGTGLMALSMFRHHADFDDARGLIEQAVAVFGEDPEATGTFAHPQAWRSWMLFMGGHESAALALADDQVARALGAGADGAARQWSMLRAMQLLELGRLADASRSARSALDLGAHDRRPGDVADANAWHVLGRVALDTGDPATLRAALIQAEDVAAGDPPRVHRMAAWLRAVAADADADHGLAMRLTAPAFATLADDDVVPPLTFPQNPADDVLLVRMALAAGEPDRAGVALAALERRAEANPRRASLTAAARQARGILDGDVAALHAAVAGWGATERALATASAREDLAVVVLADDRAAAVAHLEEARTIYERLGAERHAGRVRRRLRDLGRRLRRVAPVDPATERIDGLTAAETAVARLVAEGATNRQVADRLFVSPHTVNSHLRRIYAKLDVRSRGELTARIAELRKTLHA